MRRVSCLLLAIALLAGCGSPESKRQRGGSAGADGGNRPEQVIMHEGSQQYWETPTLIPGAGPPLDAAEHARSVSGGRRR